MAIGFSDRFDFSPIIGWELYQVTIDKYHVMFWFENENCLLNVADRFSFTSADKTVSYIYEIYGAQKSLNLDRILRVKVADIRIIKSGKSIGAHNRTPRCSQLIPLQRGADPATPLPLARNCAEPSLPVEYFQIWPDASVTGAPLGDGRCLRVS